MAQRIRPLVRVAPWIVVLLGALGPWEVQGSPPAPEGLVIRLESGHPWRPPFGLDRVGQPFTAVIESSEPPRHCDYLPTVLVETRSYRLTFDLVSGAIQSLRVKPEDWELSSGPASIVARQQDRGDLWELYRGLDGGSKIAITNRQDAPRSGQARFSDEFKGRGLWPEAARWGGILLGGRAAADCRLAQPAAPCHIKSHSPGGRRSRAQLTHSPMEVQSWQRR
jgi:hypothetical protein